MWRLRVPLVVLVLLGGCKSPGETVVGRANGRDLVVTQQEVQERVKEKGVSREEALRELRREQEMRLAVEAQKDWKSSAKVHVEGVKVRTQTDQPTAPDEEEITEFVSQARSKRSGDGGKSATKEEPAFDGDSEAPSKLDKAVDRLGLPEQRTEFQESQRSEGWRLLPE